MSGFIRRNAIALLALAVALSGTAYAAIELPNGSVTGPMIKNNAITSSKIAKDTIRANDISTGGVKGNEIANGTISSLDLGANSVTGAAVGADAILGEDILESSLGPVPSANDTGALGGVAAASYSTDAEAALLAARVADVTANGGETGLDLDSGFSTRGTANITAPRAGLIVFNANATIHPALAETTTNDCVFDARFFLNGVSTSLGFGALPSGSTTTDFETFSINDSVAVPAGTYSFAAQVRVNPNITCPATNDFLAGGIRGTAMFVPLNGAGG